jgi:hypothetical protein
MGRAGERVLELRVTNEMRGQEQLGTSGNASGTGHCRGVTLPSAPFRSARTGERILSCCLVTCTLSARETRGPVPRSDAFCAEHDEHAATRTRAAGRCSSCSCLELSTTSHTYALEMTTCRHCACRPVDSLSLLTRELSRSAQRARSRVPGTGGSAHCTSCSAQLAGAFDCVRPDSAACHPPAARLSVPGCTFSRIRIHAAFCGYRADVDAACS